MPKVDVSMLKQKPIVRLGNEYGFCYVPLQGIDQHAVVYSFGAGEDISTDIEIAKRFRCNIQIFDPTPRALLHFQTLVKNTSAGEKTKIGGRNEFYFVDEKTLSLLNFHAVGLWNENTKVKFFAPKNPEHVSYSITNLQKTDNFIEVEVKTISTLMKELNHTKIDYLKMDIEGAEYNVLDAFFKEKPNVNSLYVEFHYPPELSFMQAAKKVKNYLIELTNVGYDIVSKEKEKNFLLVKRTH